MGSQRVVRDTVPFRAPSTLRLRLLSFCLRAPSCALWSGLTRARCAALSHSLGYLYLCMPCQHAGSAPSRAVPRPRTPRVHGLATTTLSQYSASGTLIFTRPASKRNNTTRVTATTHITRLRHASRLGCGSAPARLRLGCGWLRLGCGCDSARRICCGSARGSASKRASASASAARRQRRRRRRQHDGDDRDARR